MEKRLYFAPSMKVTASQAEGILATSQGVTSDPNADGTKPIGWGGNSDGTQDPDAKGRDDWGSIW